MPSLGEKLQNVVNAYRWEQKQITIWRNAMSNLPPDGTTGPVGPEFLDIWKSYFAYVSESNDLIINYCQDAIDKGKEKDAVDKLNSTEHHRGWMKAIEKEASKHAGVSDYLAQLDALLNLEFQTREYLAAYLVV
jgi:hypothetical protein